MINSQGRNTWFGNIVTASMSVYMRSFQNAFFTWKNVGGVLKIGGVNKMLMSMQFRETVNEGCWKNKVFYLCLVI